MIRASREPVDFVGAPLPQGDVLFTQVDALPEDAKLIGDASKEKVIVTHSETGHHHYIEKAEAKFYGTSNPDVCYLQMVGAASLQHNRSYDTHGAVNFPAGCIIKVNRQKEPTGDGDVWRRVVD